MKCPNCGLENPNSAMICDCGFDFSKYSKKEIKVKNIERKNKETLHKHLLCRFSTILGITILILLPLVNVFIGKKTIGNFYDYLIIVKETFITSKLGFSLRPLTPLVLMPFYIYGVIKYRKF